MTEKNKAPVATEALQTESSKLYYVKNHEEKQIIKVTNQEFLQTLFGEDYIWSHVTSFLDPPDNIPNERRGICWGGNYFSRTKLIPNSNQYFCISSFFADDEKKARRRKALFRATHVIVVDDVREKLPEENVKKLPPPTYKLETSHGSQQWGYKLDRPCTDRNKVDNLLDGLVAQGLAPDGKDPGMKGVTRYVRLPEGVNTKAKRVATNGGTAPRCKVLEWNPSQTVSLEELALPFKVELEAVRRESRIDGAADLPDHPLLAIPEIINIKSVRSDGRYDITCPWVQEHTGKQDDGAAIFTNEDGSIGFKCHHGSCQHRTGKDLLDYIEEEIPDFRRQLKSYEIRLEFDRVVAVPPDENDKSGDFNFLGTPDITSSIPPIAPVPPKSLNQWDEPLLFGKNNCPKISASILPSWLGEYAGAVAKTTQTPEGMAVMLALSTIATCLQKRFIISPYGGDYREPINIWTVTALPPASRKTAVISAMTDPLSIWEKEQSERMIESIKTTMATIKVNLARIDKLTKDAAKKKEPSERQSILDEIYQLEKDTPEEIKSPRLWTGDVTPERLQGLLVEHGEKMALISDEGGIFEIMAGLYSNGKANIDVFLQAHAGSPVRVDRASRTAILDAPSLTFGLAVQPAVIADLSQGNKKTFRSNGSLARFLYCLPQNNIGRRDVRKRDSVPESVKSNYCANIIDLLNIKPEIGQDGKEHPRLLKLDQHALESWLDFSAIIESKQGPNGEYELIQDWTGKLPGAVLRISGLFHVVEHGTSTLIVNQSTMERALDLAALLIDHAQAAFNLMGADQTSNDAQAILQWITDNNQKQFTKNEVRKALKGRWTRAERLNQALAVLKSRDIIGAQFKSETKGRSATTYPVNPYLIDMVKA